MKAFTMLSGLAAIAVAAPYPTAPAPSAGLPPPPPSGSGFPAPTGMPPQPSGGFPPVPSGGFPPHPSGGFPHHPNGTHPHPSGYGHHPPPPPYGTAPPKPPTGTAPAKRAAQLDGFSFPSFSLPTGGFGGASGFASPTGLGSGSGSGSEGEGGLGGFSGISGIAAPTGISGSRFGLPRRNAQLDGVSSPVIPTSFPIPTGISAIGTGALPSISFPTGGFESIGAGSASPTGLSGFGRGKQHQQGAAAPSGGPAGVGMSGAAGPSGGLPEPSKVVPSGVAAPTGAGEGRGFGSLAVNTRLAESGSARV